MMPLRLFLALGLVTCFHSIAAAQAANAPADVARRVDQLLVKDKAGQPLPELCDDATFLRRASMDLTGKLPDAADPFLKDSAPNKRALPSTTATRTNRT